MLKKLFIPAIMLTMTLSAPLVRAEDSSPKVPMAQLCANCHKTEPGVMMGFLENIALKSKTIQMNFLTHKEVVSFDETTELKNVASLEDIRNFLNKGFTIKFTEKNGRKHATLINRFDVLKTIESGQYKVGKLNKEEFKARTADAKVVVYDVRPPAGYQESHIAGAKMLPAPAFEKFKDQLPVDKATPVVLYDTGGCLSPTVAFNVKSMGYEDVSIYTAGFPDWSKTDYGVTTEVWLKEAIDKGVPHVLVDLRDQEAIVKGHIKGAVGISFEHLDESKGKFPAQKNAPIVLYGPNQEQAAGKLVEWGYRAVRLLPIDFEAWQRAGNLVQTGPASNSITYVPQPKLGTIESDDFRQTTTQPSVKVMVVDVRNADEVAEDGMVKGAVNIPLDQVSSRLDEFPADKEAVLYCPTGVRAEMAQTILREAGKKSRYLDAKITVKKDGSYIIEEK
jgi:rhodanese-related sulfurtransferase